MIQGARTATSQTVRHQERSADDWLKNEGERAVQIKRQEKKVQQRRKEMRRRGAFSIVFYFILIPARSRFICRLDGL